MDGDDDDDESDLCPEMKDVTQALEPAPSQSCQGAKRARWHLGESIISHQCYLDRCEDLPHILCKTFLQFCLSHMPDIVCLYISLFVFVCVVMVIILAFPAASFIRALWCLLCRAEFIGAHGSLHLLPSCWSLLKL